MSDTVPDTRASSSTQTLNESVSFELPPYSWGIASARMPCSASAS